jgi:ubiquinone/menaquinone biosynthesis C-methylase UbiE
VLDIGCGVGDVSLLVAKLAGSTEAVVGIDQDPGALSIASERAIALGAKHIGFARGHFRNYEFNGQFDPATGRYVLMYQADPAPAIKSTMTRLKPGELAVFQELDMSRVPIARPKLAQSMRSILPMLEVAGIASREEVEIGTPARRLKAELALRAGFSHGLPP